MRANLNSIAELSGYSPSTVSRVLSGKSQVKDDTKQKIMQAAEKLKYRPNLLVKGLQTGRTGTVGILAKLGDCYFDNIIHGIHDRLAEDGSVPILQITGRRPDGSDIGIPEIDQLHAMLDRMVDGIIMLPVNEQIDDTDMARIMEDKIPLVLIDRELEAQQTDFVGTDNLAGGEACANYLLKRGHHNIGHIAGPDFTSAGRYRRRGFVSTLEAAGARISVVVDSTFTGNEQSVKQLLGMDRDITAIFAANDSQAAHVLKYLHGNGIKVPEEIEVVGFGNLEISSLLYSGITTFDQKPYEIGQTAASLLLERQNKNESKSDPEIRKIYLRPEIIERGSTR